MLQSPSWSVLSPCKWTIARAAFPRPIRGRSVGRQSLLWKVLWFLWTNKRTERGSSGELAPRSTSWMMKDCLGVKSYFGPEVRFQHCLLCKDCRCTDECFRSKRTSLKHPHKAAGTTVQIQYLAGRVQKMLGSHERLGR